MANKQTTKKTATPKTTAKKSVAKKTTETSKSASPKSSPKKTPTTKKSCKYLDLALKVFTLVLGVAAISMGFVVAVKFTTNQGDLLASYTGFQVAFGYAVSVGSLATITTQYLSFSILALFALILPVAGAVMTIFKNKIVRIIGVGLMVVGAIFMFLMPMFTVLATVNGEFTLAAELLNVCTRSVGIGGILGGIFSLLGGIVTSYSIFKK